MSGLELVGLLAVAACIGVLLVVGLLLLLPGERR